MKLWGIFIPGTPIALTLLLIMVPDDMYAIK